MFVPPDDLIDMSPATGEAPALAVTSPVEAVVASTPTLTIAKPSKFERRLMGIRPDAATKVYAEWLSANCEPYDFVVGKVSSIGQIPNATLEKIYNGRLWPTKLPLYQVQYMRMGSGPSIHVKPRWNPGRPAAVVRFDLDQHGGESDGQAAADFLSRHFSAGSSTTRRRATAATGLGRSSRSP